MQQLCKQENYMKTPKSYMKIIKVSLQYIASFLYSLFSPIFYKYDKILSKNIKRKGEKNE